QPTTAITQSRYFLITMTNYPNVLLRTQQYQEPPIQSSNIYNNIGVPYSYPIHPFESASMLDTIEGFEDIFGIINDDNDTFENTIEELNKYFISGHLNSFPNEEEIIDGENIDDYIGDDINMTEEMQEEEILSQSFSQLSTASDDEERSFVTNKRQRSNVASSPTILVQRKGK
ncbi:unnamed protein product, partial [Rotaria magnacalcarata]